MVTVIIPCYNYGRYLSETLQSVLSQSYQDWECIVVNDGSTDNTKEVAHKFVELDQRFKYIEHENKGHSASRNIALEQAKGIYIQFLDADDLLEYRKLELQVALFEANSHIDFVYSSMLIFNTNDPNRTLVPFVLLNQSFISGKNEVILNGILTDSCFLPGCVLFKRKIFLDIGGLNESLYGLEDWNYWYKIALGGYEFYYDNRKDVRLLVRDHESNTSKVRDKMMLSKIQARTNVITNINSLIDNNKISIGKHAINSILNQHLALLHLENYEYHISYGSKSFALKSMLKYSIKSNKPFYPIGKMLSILQSRIFNSKIL